MLACIRKDQDDQSGLTLNELPVVNISIGILSSIVDNIPVMFAVLTMNPDMSTGQWLLVTLTAGVGGSLLSIGSAAGVALMGQARGSRARGNWHWLHAPGCLARPLPASRRVRSAPTS